MEREFVFVALDQPLDIAPMLDAALAMHDTFLKKGDMRLTDFGEYLITPYQEFQQKFF